MRILYDSKQLAFKDPFGTLTPGQSCTIHIHIPAHVQATGVRCLLNWENGPLAKEVPLEYKMKRGAYEIFQGKFSLEQTGLYFYYFFITTRTGGFRLFKAGNKTNMEAGDQWQLSCVPADFTTPDWAKGGTMYQVFPDRFCKSGRCDLRGKLEPYTVHETWNEEVDWRPTPEGVVLNNDFFGGNFRGVTEKMDYIASLGTTVLYLNPISKSFSSHRYDTGDYKTPDPMLGTEEDFVQMCKAAHARGIRVILDGVYSHTGSNSLYFDKEGAFGGHGAYTDPNSPYRTWYTFHQYPNSYNSWWNFDTLPAVNKMEPSFVEYIITGKDSVVEHWLKLGADGFRLDVVDELPNEFIALLKRRIREIKPDALLVGEVWEDASNKTAYGIRKRYFVDGVLDSCMNYPFRTAILNYIKGWDDGRAVEETVMTIAENYPPQVLCCNMNLLGTHDTPRILTALVDDFDGSREEKAKRHLSRTQYYTAQERLLMASFLQYTLPGMPSIYYGDEAGMEGYKDPFNRRPYPWGREDMELLNHYRRLGLLRKNNAALRLGDISFFQAGDRKIGFTRTYEGVRLRVCMNRSSDPWELPSGLLIFGHNIHTVAPDWLILGPKGFCVVQDA
ncbi:MAG TPA: glycoside hydrolase family 13 protein [Candidatus Faecousia intestinigallinarum]|nr:glycoside hydrolase family 13 protein [Candidatus Faecousia intestinigallinarum]